MSEFLQLLLSGLAVGGIYAMVALGFTLIYKATSIFNFAVGNFVTISAFTTWTAATQFHLPIGVSIVIGLAAGALVGWLFDRLALRRMIGQPQIALIAMTLGLMVFLTGISVLIWGGRPRSFSPFMPAGIISLGDIIIAKSLLISFVSAMVIVGILIFFFHRARAGLAMRATAEDQQVAQAAGIRVKSVFTQIWVIAGLCCGVGGVLLGTVWRVDLALSEFGLKVIPAVMIGGIESIPGAVIGGLMIGILEKLAAGYINPIVGGGIQTVFAYVIMLLFLVAKPYGLFGLKRIERI